MTHVSCGPAFKKWPILWVEVETCSSEKVSLLQIELSSKCSPNDRDWSPRMCGFPPSPSFSKPKQSITSHTPSAAGSPPLESFYSPDCQSHQSIRSLEWQLGGEGGKWQVPQYVSADLLGACKMLLSTTGVKNRTVQTSSKSMKHLLKIAEVVKGSKCTTRRMCSSTWEWLVCPECGLYALWERSPWLLCHINGLLKFCEGNASFELATAVPPTSSAWIYLSSHLNL